MDGATVTAAQNSGGWGFLVMLLGLLLLLVFFGWLPRKLRGARKADEAQTWVPVTIAEPEAKAPAPMVMQEDTRQMEIAAAIAAVTAIVMEEQNGLRVRPMRRVGVNAPAWNVAGRRENREF